MNVLMGYLKRLYSSFHTFKRLRNLDLYAWVGLYFVLGLLIVVTTTEHQLVLHYVFLSLLVLCFGYFFLLEYWF